MPQIVNEIDKKFDVKDMIFYSSNEAVIVAKDMKSLNVILDLLHTLIRNSGFDGAEKLDFKIANTTTTTSFYPKPRKALVVNGDLNQVASSLFQTQCISNDMFQKLNACISKLPKELYESKEEFKVHKPT